SPESVIGAPIGMIGSSMVANVSSGTCRLTGSITGQGLSKQGTGTLYLSGNNTFGGPVQVLDGVLVITSPGALGTSASGTSLLNSGSLQIDPAGGSLTIGGESLDLGSPSSNPALRLVSGDATWAGPITVSAPATIRNDSGGPLRLQGGVFGSQSITIPG